MTLELVKPKIVIGDLKVALNELDMFDAYGENFK